MPKVTARVRGHEIKDGRLFVTLEFDRHVKKITSAVTVKWGSTRSLSQNSLYWAFLTWVIEHGGLKDQGHFDPYALHLDLKAHFLAEKQMTKGQFKAIEESTTTTLDKQEFGEYVDKVNLFFQEFFQLDTAPFWEGATR